MECAIAIAQENAYVIAEVIACHQIELAVVVEIGGNDENGGGVRLKSSSRPECAVTIAEQDAHVVAVLIGYRQVQGPVSIKIPDRHGIWGAFNWIVNRRREKTWKISWFQLFQAWLDAILCESSTRR